MDRDQRNIWTLNDRAMKKRPGMVQAHTEVKVPLSVVRDLRLSIMENVVMWLREKGLTNQQVASILKRSRKTVSTVYVRANKKLEETRKSSREKTDE